MKYAIYLVCLALSQAIVHAEQTLDTAVFAGGCFWCMEPPFDDLDGVISTTSGYIGGHVDKPTYQSVTGGGTGHYEAIKIEYDPAKIGYQELLDVYWMNVDPFNPNGQFCDIGPQYRAAIFADSEHKQLAEQSKKDLQKKSAKPIVTEILAMKMFYPAEDYHQDYYLKNPIRYKYYRFSCGRDKKLKEIKQILSKPLSS